MKIDSGLEVTKSDGKMQIDSRSNTFFKFLRAVAITGVIYRHVSLDEYMLNTDFWSQHFFLLTYFLLGSFTVSLFIFLAGYFGVASYRKSTALVFWKKRFTRLGIPYLFWSLVILLIGVLIFQHTYSCRRLAWILLSGKACLPFYFFVVLFQLALLTPFLFAWAKNRTFMWLTYVVSFLYVAGYGYAYIFYNTPFSLGVTPVTLFVPWLALYWSGMLCNLYEDEIHSWLHRRKNFLLSLTVIAYLCSFGSIMYLFHVQNIQTTLVFRNLTIFTFIPINLLLFVLFYYRHTVIRNQSVTLIGSYSYGIFLIHMPFLWLLSKIHFFQAIREFPVPYTAIMTLATLCCCVIAISMTRNILGKKNAAWIGF